MSDVPPIPEGATGEDIDDILDQILNQALAETAAAGEEAVPFLGIPEELVIGRQSSTRSRSGEVGFIEGPPRKGFTGPTSADAAERRATTPSRRQVRFTEFDVWAWLSRPGNEIAEHQERLVNAGLLQRNSYEPGIWGEESQAAERQLLGMSNLSGKDPGSLIVELSGLTASRREKLRTEAVRRATAEFVKADAATARTVVKKAVKELIRRDPTDAEMAEITAAWRRFEGEDLAQQQQAAAAQAEFDAGFRDTLGSSTDVDPEARLEEFLSQRFAGTIAQNKRVEEMQIGQHNLLNMADRMARLIGGT